MEQDIIDKYEERIEELERKVKALSYLELEMFAVKKQVKKNKNAITFFKISILITMILMPIFAVVYVLRLIAMMSL